MKECSTPGSFDSLFFDPSEPVSQEVFWGSGVSSRVGDFARSLGGHALVVTDKGVLLAGHPTKVIHSLNEAGLKTVLYDRTVQNPTDQSVQACAREVASMGIDLIIGVGGGSSLDTAKGANFILTNGGSMKDYWGVDKAKHPLLPMIAIPTTAGTGSECQSYALISDDLTHRKMACGDASALPKVTLLDPELTLSQPFSVCAATGMDALAHALESAVCTRRNALSARHASKGFSLLIQNLEAVWKQPDNLEARGAVLLGAAHAGAAIEKSMLGAAHAMANPLTARKGVIHGQAVSLTLPAVLVYNSKEPTILNTYANLARSAGLANADESDREAFDSLLQKVVQFRKSSGMPVSLTTVGCEDSDLDELASDAADQWTATFNPRPVGRHELLKLYQSLSMYG